MEESKSKMVGQISENAIKVSTIVVALLYVCGFLTTSAYLHKYGVMNTDIASSNYLISGSVFLFFVLSYALFAGRGVINIKQWIISEKEYLDGNEKFIGNASFLAAYSSSIDLVFFHCLSVSAFVSVAFADSSIAFFNLAMLPLFLIIYPLDFLNIDIKYPKFSLHLKSLLKMTIIAIFFMFSMDINTSGVLALFFGFTMYINLVLDRFERYKVTSDSLLFSIGYFAIFFFGAAVSFGSLIYGEVSHKIGGGQAIDIEFVMKSTNQLPSEIVDSDGRISSKLIYESSKYVYVERDEQTFVIPSSQIEWIQLHKPQPLNLLLKIIPEALLNQEAEKST